MWTCSGFVSWWLDFAPISLRPYDRQNLELHEMHTDFVAANVEEAPAILAQALPSDKWTTLSGWKGLHPVSLGNLLSIAASTAGAKVAKPKMPLIGGDPKTSPLLVEVGLEFRDVMAQLNSDQMKVVADAWVQTEEIRIQGWAQPDARRFVKELNQLAKVAATNQKNLLMWIIF